MSKIQLSKNFIKSSCKLALNEDLFPSGDITSDIIDNNQIKKIKLISNQKCIIGGMDFFKETFRLIDRKIKCKIKKKDGLEIKKGSVASILGPNGCGKTTLFRMIAGMLTPSKGTAFIDSVDVRKDKQTVKSKIGYMTNNTSLYDRLNVIETVKFFAELNQISPDVYMPVSYTHLTLPTT